MTGYSNLFLHLVNKSEVIYFLQENLMVRMIELTVFDVKTIFFAHSFLE